MGGVVRLNQVNNVLFRAQLLRNDGDNQYVLWVAESKDQIYTVTFERILAADIYSEDENGDYQAILLLQDQDEEGDSVIHTMEVGKFDRVNGVAFLSWLQNSLQSMAA